jgi:hypothetical protein
MRTVFTTMLFMAVMYILFMYGYSYSVTLDVFPIQGYIGALLPCVLGLMLFAIGLLVGLECNETD